MRYEKGISKMANKRCCTGNLNLNRKDDVMKNKERTIRKLKVLIDESINYGNIALTDRILELLITYIPDEYVQYNLTFYVNSLRRLMIFNVLNDDSFMNLIICRNLVDIILIDHKKKQMKAIIKEIESFADSNSVK